MQEIMQGIDSKALNNLKTLLGEADFVSLLISFMDRSSTYLEQIKLYANDGDYESLHFSAHTLKGSSANIGALQLSELCATLDRAALDKHKNISQSQNIQQMIEDIESQLQRVKQHLQKNYC